MEIEAAGNGSDFHVPGKHRRHDSPACEKAAIIEVVEHRGIVQLPAHRRGGARWVSLELAHRDSHGPSGRSARFASRADGSHDERVGVGRQPGIWLGIDGAIERDLLADVSREIRRRLGRPGIEAPCADDREHGGYHHPTRRTGAKLRPGYRREDRDPRPGRPRRNVPQSDTRDSEQPCQTNDNERHAGEATLACGKMETRRWIFIRPEHWRPGAPC